MKLTLLLLTASGLGGLFCLAQDTAPPLTPPPSPTPKATLANEDAPLANTTTPPTSDTTPSANDAEAAANDAAVPATAKPQPSLTVQVEKLQISSSPIDPKSVTLRAPFPAKPLAPVPPGWHLASSADAPPFIRVVDLAPATTITLNIRPHLLVPDATSFSITEPGFNPTLGYRQLHTISAILATTNQQLDADAVQLGNAIDKLQQLVSSLPKPPPPPQPLPPPPISPKQPNKR
jgi:hypothetical protein